MDQRLNKRLIRVDLLANSSTTPSKQDVLVPETLLKVCWTAHSVVLDSLN